MASICACRSCSSRRPNSWISSGDRVVVVDAFSAHVVVLVAARTRPHPGVVRGRRSLCLQLAQLALERGRDLACCDRPRALGPGAGNVLGAPFDGLDEHPAFARVLRRETHLPQRLVDQERRGHEARGARGLHPAELAVELLRVGLESREIRLGVSGVLDSMLGVEKPRDIEIRADVLNDHIGRVAPASDGHIAVGEREPFERRCIGASNDLDAGARGVGEPGRVEGVDPRQVGAKLVRDLLLSLRRAIAELRRAGRLVRRCRCRATSRSPARGGEGCQRSDRVARVRRPPWLRIVPAPAPAYTRISATESPCLPALR